MTNNNAKAIKSGAWYTVSNFIAKSIGFLTTPIFARMLTKEEFGIYNNYASWLLIASVFVTLNLESTLISARYDYGDRFDEYIFSMLGLSSFSTFFWLIIITVFRATFSRWWNLDIKYIYAMLVYLFFSPVVSLFQNRERYLFEYKKTVALSLFLTISTSLLSVLLVYSFNDKVMGRILGIVFPTALLGMILYVFFFRKGRKIVVGYWKYALPICLPYIPHLLASNLLNAMDKTMITKWCGAEDNAMYSLAYTCGSIVTLLTASLNGAYAPWLGEKLAVNSEEAASEIRHFSRVYVFCFMAMAIGLMAVTPEILWVLGGKQYLDAKYVLAPISMGCVCQFLYTLFVNVEQFKKKTIGMAMASVIAALINYGLNCYFIPRFGYLAAAYTTLVGYAFLLFFHMILVKKIRFDYVYSYTTVILSFCAGMLIMGIITFLYSYNMVRYILTFIYLMILLMVALKNKRTILATIKRLKEKS